MLTTYEKTGISLLAAASSVLAQTGQPKFTSTGANTFEIIGESGVSAQQVSFDF